MSDELCSAVLKDPGIRVLLAVCTEAARHGERVHHAKPAAATLLAQGLSAVALLGALQKERTRVNLQLECDGPLRGLFADADNEGNVRGYVKNPLVEFQAVSDEYRFRPILGNKGFLSVLRDMGGGEHYRSAVELEAFDFSRDLERYFRSSDQVESVVDLEVFPDGTNPLGRVAGLLLQLLPGGDRQELHRLREALVEKRGLAHALKQAEPSAHGLLTSLFSRPDLEVMSRFPVQYRCRCSRERVMSALIAMGRTELEDMIAKEGKASVTCDFCTTHYEFAGDELRKLLA